ncbi:MAG: PE family protein, partial [Planctomycetota bacterium]|nr:PE family protein [Planctomycetota bacterium]
MTGRASGHWTRATYAPVSGVVFGAVSVVAVGGAGGSILASAATTGVAGGAGGSDFVTGAATDGVGGVVT